MNPVNPVKHPVSLTAIAHVFLSKSASKVHVLIAYRKNGYEAARPIQFLLFCFLSESSTAALLEINTSILYIILHNSSQVCTVELQWLEHLGNQKICSRQGEFELMSV